MSPAEDPNTLERLQADLKKVEAERDRLLHLLLRTEEDARRHDLDLASLERVCETQEASARQSAESHRDAADTIERQENRLADQREALADMTTERDESATRADRLQVDVTRQTLEVREKEQLLALVMDVSVDGVLVYRAVQDDQGQIVDFECVLHNPAANKIYGIDGLAGKRLLDMHPDVRIKGLWDRYIAVMDTGEPFEGEYNYAPDGAERWFRVLAVKLDIGIAIMFSDITQRKEMESQIMAQLEQLQHADQMKNNFLGIVSHELRTPINAITGFASILEDEINGALNGHQQEYVQKILLGAEHLIALVDNLLDMSRMQAGQFSVDPQPNDFLPIVTGVLDSMASIAAPRAFVNEVPAGLPLVLVDEARVAQVLNSLVGNAIKFTPSDGAIAVRAWVDGDVLRCEVADTGIGISPENLAKLFQVFVQLDMTSTRAVGGVGLGLTFSKGLIEAHGGEIGAESEEGRGSTFWFTVPLALDAPA